MLIRQFLRVIFLLSTSWECLFHEQAIKTCTLAILVSLSVTCSLSDLDSNTFNLLGWLGVYAIQVMLLGNGYIIWLISSLPLKEF